MPFNMITAEEYFMFKCPSDTRTAEELVKCSKDHRKCEICGEPVWKLAQTGMCFHHTTGEFDDSYDYELIEE